jgi:AcrR family transcriptional regulator
MGTTRSESTKRLLVATFSKLLLTSKLYESLTVRDIANEAGVARSTFYQHFRTKSQILAESLRVPFTPLVKCVTGDASVGELQDALDHFWENRSIGRGLFQGSNRRFVGRVLAAMVRNQLKTRRGISPAQRSLLSVMIAEAQLGTVAAWISGDLDCSSAAMAEMVTDVSRTLGMAALPS